MDPTAESLFKYHFAKHGEATTDDTSSPEAAAFQLLCELHPEHAEELKRLRGLGRPVDDALPGTVDKGTPGGPGESVGGERFAPGSMVLDRYRIVGLLGRGGMGEVYRADDLTLGQPVALKFLSEKQAWSEDLRKRFLEEVRLARDVSHPSICRVFDVGEVDGQIFLTMEYVDGEDLTSLLLRVGRLPSEKAIEIARQLCAGLAAVHERGIVHRDLKPGNVMIDGRGAVKIADFGLAGVFETGGEAAGEIIGTPAYMAPELTEGKGPSVASDIYALGLVLYEIFTGHPAFTGKTHNEYFQAHREEAPKSPSSYVTDLDPAIEEVLDRCLEKNPALRPASALAVSGALPGGDPLAEALARGETPSPEAVAAAGGAGALRPAVAYGWLTLAVIAFYAICWVVPKVTVFGEVPLELRPEVLEHRARELLDGPLMFTENQEDWNWNEVHTATGLVGNGSYGNWREGIINANLAGEKLEMPTGDLLPPYYFWLRASQYPIYSGNPNLFVTHGEPELGLREAIVLLRPDGSLDSFSAFYGTSSSEKEGRAFDDDTWEPYEASGPSRVNGDELLQAAGFDPESMRPVRPYSWPKTPMDLRLAWQGPAPGGVEGEAAPPEVIVEAGFLKTLPVSLKVSDPKLPQEVSSYSRPEEDVWGARLAFLKERTMSFMIILMITVGAFLMLRNLHQRRGDRPRAARLAWFVVLAMTLRWFLLTSWTSNFAYDFWRFGQAFGNHLFFGGACWVLYLGLEPYIRRVWPHMLIGWTRVISGRWRDPMVGRDVILGLTAGLLITLVEPLGFLFVTAIGSPPPVSFLLEDEALEGTTASVANILMYVRITVILTLVVFLMLSLLQSLLRSRVAAVVLCVIVGLLGMPAAGTLGGPLADNAIGLLKISIWLFFALRFGVLTAALMQFVHMISGSWPLTNDFSAWYATPTITFALVLGPLAVFAARTACRGSSGVGVKARAG